MVKQKLQKKPKLYADNKAFVEDLIVKGYARKVPEDRLNRNDGKVRYIPHHGVYHPHNPDKIRVVFDCSSKFKGASLNDLLLPGLDFTNDLIGVLIRFRQDPLPLSQI